MSTVFSSALVDTAEHHALLRDSVGKLAGRFGRRYFQDLVKRQAKPDELWQALGEAGYLGVHVPEKYGGGGADAPGGRVPRAHGDDGRLVHRVDLDDRAGPDEIPAGVGLRQRGLDGGEPAVVGVATAAGCGS